LILKIVPGAGYGTYTENRPIADKQSQKSTNGREERWTEFPMCLPEHYLELVKCFQRIKQKVYIYISVENQ
jgi:hypothetical protein